MSTFRIPILFIAISLASLGTVIAQALDISSGGTPTITGSLNGSVSGNSATNQDLAFIINFGEISPINPNNLIKAVLPIAVRSNQPYQVSVSMTGGTDPNSQGLQRSDIGFGINNIRRQGSQARLCTLSTHLFYSPFDNDPSTNITLDANGRARYISSLGNITTSNVILSGPRLSSNNPNRQGNDAWIFDAILVITPQYFVTSTTSSLVTFTISAGPNVPC